MPNWIPHSIFGAAVTVVYLALAVSIVAIDRRETGGGGWISLGGMGSYLATFPVSFPGELLGMRPDYRRNVDMAFAIGMCAILVYFASAGVAKVTHMIFTK